MEEDSKYFNENKDFDYNNGHSENDNESYRENKALFYDLIEIYNMKKRENNNINNRIINENENIRQNCNDNLAPIFNRNLNHIQATNENNIGYQPQNPNFHQNIQPPPYLNPNYNQIIMPNFIPSYILIPNIICVGMPPHGYLDSRIPFQNGLGLPPNFNNQFPGPNYLSQSQNLPNMAPFFWQNFNKDNLIQMKNNNKSNFVIRENDEINRNNMKLNQINNQDIFNSNIIYFPKYKSDLDFRNLCLPDIRNKILNIAQNYNYSLTKEEERMLFDPNIILNNDTVFINEYMFYSPFRISLYAPHIIRGKNGIISLLLSKDLNISDFQCDKYYKKNNNNIFLKTLIKRIKEYNKLRKNKGAIDDDNYNEKIFGFNFNINNNNFYLYSTLDEDIISNKLKEIHQNKNDNNIDYFEELTFEELIIYTILERLEYKYELLPNIIYYEYYLTINGDRVIFDNNNDLTGYSNIDYVIYSKCDYIYNKDKTPLIIKERYRLNGMENEVQFEIKKDTLYFYITIIFRLY
jgi:hypothetical protein